MDIQALMDALKAAGSSGPGKPIGAKLSVMKALPMDDMSDDSMGGDDEPAPEEGDETADPERNQDIVDALQTDYPTIYAKITKQLDEGDNGPPDDGGGDLSALSDSMPPMGAPAR